jgi:carbonic anhydrase
MDARVDPYDIFNLKIGEAHVIRNAGGVVTDDVIRSISISQELLLSTEIIVMHHMDCGMTKFCGKQMKWAFQQSIGQRPAFSFEDFGLKPSAENVRENVKRVMQSPFIRHKRQVSGCVYNDCTGSIKCIPTNDIKPCLANNALVENQKCFSLSGQVPLYGPREDGTPGGQPWNQNPDDIREVSACYHQRQEQ